MLLLLLFCVVGVWAGHHHERTYRLDERHTYSNNDITRQVILPPRLRQRFNCQTTYTNAYQTPGIYWNDQLSSSGYQTSGNCKYRVFDWTIGHSRRQRCFYIIKVLGREDFVTEHRCGQREADLNSGRDVDIRPGDVVHMEQSPSNFDNYNSGAYSAVGGSLLPIMITYLIM